MGVSVNSTQCVILVRLKLKFDLIQFSISFFFVEQQNGQVGADGVTVTSTKDIVESVSSTELGSASLCGPAKMPPSMVVVIAPGSTSPAAKMDHTSSTSSANTHVVQMVSRLL